MMDELFLIGIGTGNPDHVTGQARRTLASADLVLIPRKGASKADLADLRRDICAEVLPATGGPEIVEFDLPVRGSAGAYLDEVEAWHDAIAQAWVEAAGQSQADGQGARRAALLVWGDPSLYDSTLRIAARLDPAPKVHVVPGITALQALTAAHAIPVNELGAPFLVTTGRRLREQGWPQGVDTVAVMLDGDCSFRTLPPEGLSIWWGAYVGMEIEILDSGPLGEVADRIGARRAEARAAHGWIMDIYLLRRG